MKKRSKRYEFFETLEVNKDTFLHEIPEIGLLTTHSPTDPEPSLKIVDGRMRPFGLARRPLCRPIHQHRHGRGDVGSSYFLPRLIGAGRAYEFLLTGDDIDAETAYRLGLISRIVPRDKLMGGPGS